MSRIYEDLRSMLRHELGVLTKKGDVTKEILDNINKLTSSIVMVESLMEKEEGGSSNDYSRRGSYDGSYDGGSYAGGSYAYGRGNSREGGNSNRSYDGGSYDYSGRRGRDSRGRYTSRDGGSYEYSGHDEKQHLIMKMQEMMSQAGTERERQTIQKCIDELEM